MLQSVIQIADLFLDKGTIVSTKSRNRYENAVYQAKAETLVPKDMRVAVLINRGSASASEILSGALKDQKRAYLVGENTYGKGSVQQVLPLGDTGFKLTMSRYYTPSDANIDKVGIAPDLEVKEPALTPAEEASLSTLIERDVFAAFAAANPNASAEDIDKYVKGLRAAGSPVSERVLKKMVRNQLERTSISPIFDLDYDLQLNAALKVLASDQFAKLLAAAPSVKDLQAKAAAAAMAAATAPAQQARQAPASKGGRIPMRQFILPASWDGGLACEIAGRDAHRLTAVLRLGPGDSFPARGADGLSYACTIIERRSGPGAAVGIAGDAGGPGLPARRQGRSHHAAAPWRTARLRHHVGQHASPEAGRRLSQGCQPRRCRPHGGRSRRGRDNPARHRALGTYGTHLGPGGTAAACRQRGARPVGIIDSRHT